MFGPHKSDPIATRTLRRPARREYGTVKGDICVLGAGISGISAALEAAKLGRRVVLVDGSPSLGGQAINSIIGTLIGLYSHGEKPCQITHGIADELVNEMTAAGDMLRRQGGGAGTVTYQYDEVKLARWMERKVEAAGIQTLLGAVLTGVEFSDRRVRNVDFATRFGPVRVRANGFVDSSGDASLCYEAGLPVREPEEPIYGTLNFLIENYDPVAVKDLSMQEIHKLLLSAGPKYGLTRHDGHLMPFTGKGIMLANIGHFETPLDPLAAAQMVFKGRQEADNVLRFLQGELPAIFKNARIRAYGNPGIRQSRWICSRRQLTLDAIRKGERPMDAVARCAWWVELHNTIELVHWERFPENHVYYIPLGCMVPDGADNIIAAGRCVDGDTHALSAIRVMGPCIAMGAAAAHALNLLGDGSLHSLDLARLQKALYDNLDRAD
ncbi:MAG: hypothetical protein A3I78_01210 [Gammaproteobacteria bacterium RIFCSPLOWO2_02_FULL_56_15]|nr:MAG: hypothetical protein A3I78_01210 [Gammaproteobacteria bacterium RIFCSPLOWO2_02_FULL_56_15]